MYKSEIKDYSLRFKRPAKTSRNTFKERQIFIITVEDGWGHVGVGEAAPLHLLSIDDLPNYKDILSREVDYYCRKGEIDPDRLVPYPSIRFGLEMVHRQLHGGRDMVWFNSDFVKGVPIPINGLVWMNDADTMLEEAIAKVRMGFDCMKFKVGALDFDEECRMLEQFRKKAPASSVQIRLDANGGFEPNDAAQQLKDLSKFNIHSIEQPIAANNWEDMARLCSDSAMDIALDEELIGRRVEEGEKLLRFIKPQFIILKPNLIGGFGIADEWIRLAEAHNIGWWATSALESNLGLSAIAQWVSQYPVRLPQGLGTGSLYTNNIETPIVVEPPFVKYVLK